MLSALFLLLSAEAPAVTATASPLVEPDPKAMSQKEIKAYNATLPKEHPFHIRCVRTLDTGSLVKGSYSCRTNRQWNAADEAGNRNARETYEAMQGKAITTN